MSNIQQIQELPQNIGAFVNEIGAALGSMYGNEAQKAYLSGAEASYSQLVRHPDVCVWAYDSPETPGLLMCVVRRGVAHITLLHLLSGENGKGIEEALLQVVTEDLRNQGVRSIIGEFVRYHPIDIEQPMAQLGFTRFGRQLMMADLADRRLEFDSTPSTSPCGDRDVLAATVLVDAYQDHPSRPLHPEAHDEESAEVFLQTYRAGGFGATTPSFYRVFMSDDACQGFIAGAEAAPGIGFILHVSTKRTARGKGIGTHLIREVASAFRDAGYGRIALGVTGGNPAEHLYERLGFEHLMPVETYAWWAAPYRPFDSDHRTNPNSGATC